VTLLSEIRGFFEHHASVLEGDRLVVAFSGGPDSTALLWGLKQVAPDLGIQLHAIHIDHELDGDSHCRAALAQGLCTDLKVASTFLHHPIHECSAPGESLEVAARRIRYHVLETQRRKLGAAYIVTAHHADDQVETILIRLLYGTGIEGLAGIQPCQNQVVRPLLRLRRWEVHQALVHTGLECVQDPTNFHFGHARNRVRHLLLPNLLAREPGLDDLLAKLARTAYGSRSAVEGRLRQQLKVQRTQTGGSIERRALVSLPAALWPFALALVHRWVGIPYPPSTAARLELERQLRSSHRVGVDCGGGWRWQSQGDQLTLSKPPPSVPGFAYTVEAPGECEIPELALRFRIRRGAVDAWMFRPSSRRAGFDLPIGPGDRVIVRSRRAGDRIRPFGCQYTRRLKDVLIDRRVPRQERGRLPLLEVDSRLVWIPGVTIDDAYRVAAGGRAWIAELESI